MTKITLLSTCWVAMISSACLVHGFATVRNPSNSHQTASLSTSVVPSHSTTRATSMPLYVKRRDKSNDDDDDDDDDDDEASDLLADSDWRDFRAKLVMGENAPSTKSSKPSRGAFSAGSGDEKSSSEDTVILDDGDLDGIGSIFQDSTTSASSSSSTSPTKSPNKMSSTDTTTDAASDISQMTPLDPSQWAYDSGKIIEQGAVILGGVEQDFGFGLRQQYFHKAAILVLDHEESTFTKGIILNRPTDLTLEDDINPGVRWRVWFGGVSILYIYIYIYIYFCSNNGYSFPHIPTPLHKIKKTTGCPRLGLSQTRYCVPSFAQEQASGKGQH